MNIDQLTFPVIAMTPNGIMPYSNKEALLTCMPKELKKGWYKNLEIVDNVGNCLSIVDVQVTAKPFFGGMFGGMCKVTPIEIKNFGPILIGDLHSRVGEFIRIYEDQYISMFGDINKILRKIKHCKTPADIIDCFIKL